MSTGLILSLLAVLLAVVLAACTRGSSPETNNPPSAEQAKAKPQGRIGTDDALEVELGSVNIKGGHIKRTFTLRNVGEGALTLRGAFTSCACTVASIILSDPPVSEKFGMKLPRNWSQVVKPGQSFEIEVDFDPLYHGETDTGPFTRTVYLITDAPSDDHLSTNLPIIQNGTVTTILLKGTTLSEGEFRTARADSLYREISGDFRYTKTEYDLGKVKQSQGIVKQEFPFLYAGEMPITVKGTPTSCGCTRAYVTNKDLRPGDEGVLVVEFDPNFHEEPEGKFFKTISLLTDPPLRERSEVRIWAEIDLDLGPNAYKYVGHKDEDEEHDDDGETN
ncbi:MAG: DUF1573 domain-containing protein [bacterium]|nr:MAG: DUF1573 domain-containing protein [bacterium]